MLDLQRVKDYLRVDSDFDDNEIEFMITGAFDYFTKETNHVFGKIEKEFYTPFRIYDFPVYDSENILIKKSNYYVPKDCPKTSFITLDVGYEEIGDVPNDIIQCILQIIKVWYYESENEQNATLLPMSVKQVIEKYRRFHL